MSKFKYRKKIYGLTGLVGSGKSVCLSYFKELGVLTIDADKIVRKLYKKGNKGWEVVKKNFDQKFFNKCGCLNKKRIGEYVFCNKKALKKLEDLIHPLVASEIENKIKKSKNSNILIESVKFPKKNLGKLVQGTIQVISPIKSIKKRIQKYTPEMIDAILANQRSGQAKYVIKNNKDKLTLKKEVKKMYQRLYK